MSQAWDPVKWARCVTVSVSYKVYFHCALRINSFTPQMACRSKFDLLGRGRGNYLLCKLSVRQRYEPMSSFHHAFLWFGETLCKRSVKAVPLTALPDLEFCFFCLLL